MMDYTVSTPEVKIEVTDIRGLEDNYFTSYLDVYYVEGYRHTGYLDFFFDEEENEIGISWDLYDGAIYNDDEEEVDKLPYHLASINLLPLVDKLIEQILPHLKEYYNAQS